MSTSEMARLKQCKRCGKPFELGYNQRSVACRPCAREERRKKVIEDSKRHNQLKDEFVMNCY